MTCPCCREECRADRAPAMPEDQAHRMAIEFDFGWWLWDEDRL